MTAPAVPVSRSGWAPGVLRDPESGLPLVHEGPNVLTDGRGRWPMVDGIPWLRAGRDELRARALRAIDQGDLNAARLELLLDRDDWASGPPPERREVAAAVRAPTLRAAMAGLRFGPVADYFAHRWSDPTYLAGLALLDHHWPAPVRDGEGGAARPVGVFELAAGIGQYCRELARRGIDTAAGDVVFAKLWLARRFVTPSTRLVCFDAASPFPLPDGEFGLAACLDAFYFLPAKAHVAAELARVAAGGSVVVAHAHNAEVDNHSAGDPLPVAGYAALFDAPLLYDDAELTASLLAGTRPAPRPAAALAGSEAVGLVAGAVRDAPMGLARGGRGRLGLDLPPPGARLRLNPLLVPAGSDPVRLRVAWPSPRYEAEYGPRSGYLTERDAVPRALLRRSVGGTAGSDPAVDQLARQRVVLDLPARW